MHDSSCPYSVVNYLASRRSGSSMAIIMPPRGYQSLDNNNKTKNYKKLALLDQAKPWLYPRLFYLVMPLAIFGLLLFFRLLNLTIGNSIYLLLRALLIPNRWHLLFGIHKNKNKNKTCLAVTLIALWFHLFVLLVICLRKKFPTSFSYIFTCAI